MLLLLLLLLLLFTKALRSKTVTAQLYEKPLFVDTILMTSLISENGGLTPPCKGNPQERMVPFSKSAANADSRKYLRIFLL